MSRTPPSAVRHDRILREFYTRLCQAGLKPLVALTAAMRKAQEGGFVSKDGGDTGTSLEFLVDALNGVGSAQKLLP